MSGWSDAQNRACEAGFDYRLMKPVPQQQLLHMAELAQQWQALLPVHALEVGTPSELGSREVSAGRHLVCWREPAALRGLGPRSDGF